MNNLISTSRQFVKHNSPTILTCIGSVGVIATAVLAVKATPKALAVIEKTEKDNGKKLMKMEVIKVAGPAYIPAAITGAATIACIFGANVLNQRKQASLMSAYALLDNSYKEYKKKVTDLYGEETDTKVRTEISKDRHAIKEYLYSENMNLYYDEYSGRHFNSTAEIILNTETKLNKILSEYDYISLNEVYDFLGIEKTDYGDYIGWSTYETCETPWISLDCRKVILDDGLEYMIMSFSVYPNIEFKKY